MTMKFKQRKTLSYDQYRKITRKSDDELRYISNSTNNTLFDEYEKNSSLHPKQLLKDAHDALIAINEVVFDKPLPITHLYRPSILKGMATIVCLIAIVVSLLTV